MRKALLLAAILGLGSSFASAQVQSTQYQDQITDELELAAYSVQRFEIPEEHTSFVVDVELGDLVYEMVVTPESFRTTDAIAQVGLEGGVIEQIDLPPSKTVRGNIIGVPGARAAGARVGEGQFSMTISLPGLDAREIWSIQPLTDAVPGADADLYVIHRDTDVVLKDPATCGLGALNLVQAHDHNQDPSDDGTRSFLECEIGIDADWEYYNIFGQNEQATIDDIDEIIARMSAIYEGQCNVTFTVPLYLVWTTSSDPYTSSDPSTRLTQFRNYWNGNVSVNRDLAHQFTGVNLDGSVIGIAWLSAVCGSNGYGVSQARFTTNINSRTALVAHEVGHNFSSNHCDGNGDCKIMCSGLGGCNGLGNPARFGNAVANTITNYAAGRPCLDEQGIPYPFAEPWESTTIDTEVWVANFGGVVTDAASNEPSSPYSLNLDGTDSIATGQIDLGGLDEIPFVSFSVQHDGVDNGEQLIVEYFDAFEQWSELMTITSDGSSQTEFVAYSAEVGVFGWWSGFSLRFRAAGSDGTDDWYIDDIAIGPFPGLGLPFYEPFAENTLDTAGVWADVSGASVSDDATNEPSEPFALLLDSNDSATTYNFNISLDQFPSFLSFYTQHKGVEQGKQLLVEYFNASGDWTEFTTITSDGNDQNTFQFFQDGFIFDAYHADMAVRFTALGGDSTDDWYIDDVRFGDEFIPDDPCVADFNDDGNVDTQDVLAFLNAWSSGDTSADINEDGNVNTQDVLEYLNLWNAGC